MSEMFWQQHNCVVVFLVSFSLSASMFSESTCSLPVALDDIIFSQTDSPPIVLVVVVQQLNARKAAIDYRPGVITVEVRIAIIKASARKLTPT